MSKKGLLDHAIESAITEKRKPEKREKQNLKPIMVLGVVLFSLTIVVTLMMQLRWF